MSSQEALMETQGKVSGVKVRCKRGQGNPNDKRMQKQNWSYTGGRGVGVIYTQWNAQVLKVYSSTNVDK